MLASPFLAFSANKWKFCTSKQGHFFYHLQIITMAFTIYEKCTMSQTMYKALYRHCPPSLSPWLTLFRPHWLLSYSLNSPAPGPLHLLSQMLEFFSRYPNSFLPRLLKYLLNCKFPQFKINSPLRSPYSPSSDILFVFHFVSCLTRPTAPRR